MDFQAEKIATKYLECEKLFGRTALDNADFWLWGEEFEASTERLDRKLRRSSSLRRLVISHLESLEEALGEYISHESKEKQESRQYVAKSLVVAEVHGLLCLSPELRGPPPSDNLKHLKKAGLSSADATLEIKSVCDAFPKASDQLRRRIGVLNWIRLKDLQSKKTENFRDLASPLLDRERDMESDISRKKPRRDTLRSAELYILKYDHCAICHKPDANLHGYDTRKHILEDLDPYVCTYGNCSEAYQMFNRVEWEEHESLVHNIKSDWICYLCRALFISKKEFDRHVELEHQKVILSNPSFSSDLPLVPQATDPLSISELYEKPAIFQLSERLTHEDKLRGAVCPLCAEVQNSDLSEHVAYHLEESSLQMLHRSGIMSLPLTDLPESRKHWKIKFFGSKIGGGRLSLEHSTSALQRFWSDVKRIFSMLSFFSLIGRPSEISESSLFEKHLELYPSLANLFHITAQFVLLLNQSMLIISLPFLLFFPLWITVSGMILFFVINQALCDFLNGRNSGQIFSNDVFTKHRLQRNDEKWIFINSVGVGKHWLQSNVDRLALTFRRPIVGLHNKTYGILLDILRCLVQRSFKYDTANTRECYRALKSALDDETISRVVLIMHGQGAIEGGIAIDWLLQEIPLEVFSKLEVYTFGCAAVHFNNPKLSPRLLNAEAAEPKPTMSGRVIRHVEHYALAKDFMSHLGVLRSTESLEDTDPETEINFAGSVFLYDGSGHLFNSHYMDVYFPLDRFNRTGKELSFMQSEVELDSDTRRQDALTSMKEVGENWSSTLLVSTDMTSLKLPTESTESRTEAGLMSIQAKDLSRLWLYRNGGTPTSPSPSSPRERLPAREKPFNFKGWS